MKYFLLLTLLTTHALATSFEVELPGYAYEAQVSREKILLKSHLMRVSLEKKNCNEALLRKLEEEFKRQSKVLVITKDPKKKIRYKRSQKEYLLNSSSDFARFLRAFPEMIQNAKKSEQLACGNKK